MRAVTITQGRRQLLSYMNAANVAIFFLVITSKAAECNTRKATSLLSPTFPGPDIATWEQVAPTEKGIITKGLQTAEWIYILYINRTIAYIISLTTYRP
jgi:hypothetical protein